MSNLTRVINLDVDGYSRSVQATFTADAAADTKSDFVACETRWMAEVSKAPGHLLSGCTLYLSDPAFSCHQKQRETTHHRQKFTCVQMHAWLIRPHSPLTSNEGGPCPPTRRMEIERLVGGPLPIIDEAHGERLAGHAVSNASVKGKEAQRLSVSATAVRYDARSASDASLD